MPDRPLPTQSSGRIHAPWTGEQVEALVAHQLDDRRHPYTCGNGHGPLQPTRDGWLCALCDYTQDWAHG